MLNFNQQADSVKNFRFYAVRGDIKKTGSYWILGIQFLQKKYANEKTYWVAYRLLAEHRYYLQDKRRSVFQDYFNKFLTASTAEEIFEKAFEDLGLIFWNGDPKLSNDGIEKFKQNVFDIYDETMEWKIGDSDDFLRKHGQLLPPMCDFIQQCYSRCISILLKKNAPYLSDDQKYEEREISNSECMSLYIWIKRKRRLFNLPEDIELLIENVKILLEEE